MGERILVVDDERIILDLTAMILRGKGFEVLVADNAGDGLAMVAQKKPSVVLLDYMMPAMDGMTALKQIRAHHPDTYVIMFTGKGSEEIAVELMKAGASDYILKPFNNKDLVERVENVLRIRRVELHNKELRAERERLLSEIEGWNRELEQRVEEKSRELERAHDEILQAEKLAALGHLSAGMAHEIRNPLNSISLFAQILQNGLGENSELAAYAEKTIKEVDRIDQILIKLLSASKRSHYELRLVRLDEVIDGVLGTFDDQIRAQGVALEKDYERVPPILADALEIEQIFSNLFANSLYEMKEGGTLGVRLGHDGETISIAVSDTGGGIDEANLHQIFDPFFTTKPRGTGFGLSVVLRIIKNYDGRISAVSTKGEGTVFNIQLPVG